jgi:hypothetical protein
MIFPRLFSPSSFSPAIFFFLYKGKEVLLSFMFSSLLEKIFKRQFGNGG